MIVGLGNDLIDIRRIESTLDKFGDRFLSRVFTDVERAKSDKRANRAASYAKRFAAKEAVVKAMGTGFVEGLFFGDIKVFNNGAGKPYVELSAKAQAMLPQQMNVFLSLSDEKTYALAFAVLEQK